MAFLKTMGYKCRIKGKIEAIWIRKCECNFKNPILGTFLKEIWVCFINESLV